MTEMQVKICQRYFPQASVVWNELGRVAVSDCFRFPLGAAGNCLNSRSAETQAPVVYSLHSRPSMFFSIIICNLRINIQCLYFRGSWGIHVCSLCLPLPPSLPPIHDLGLDKTEKKKETEAIEGRGIFKRHPGKSETPV